MGSWAAPRKSLKRGLIGTVVAFAVVGAGHELVRVCTRIEPPTITLPKVDGGYSWVRTYGGLREVYLEGTAEEIGAQNTRLLYPQMVTTERALWDDFERYVPWGIARAGLEDYSLLRYRNIGSGIPEARRRELAAQAEVFRPDPFASHMPTYQRMVFLSALYDITLPLEHSPLIGCTSFALPGAGGHELVARAFDFEAGAEFDKGKVVYLVKQDGAIPFASVAWPGFVGVVTGMNAEGVVMVVHGGRARRPASSGIPVAFSMREALAHAHTADEAASILKEQAVMVSHIVFVADAKGAVDIVERAPGEMAFVRRLQGKGWVTNAFVGPLANDPENLAVRSTTTSDDRATRIEALLERAPVEATPIDVLALLRDHQCARDEHCALGDRRAIDALIATHGIVADATEHSLWVSLGPHLTGAFVRLDLDRLFASSGGEPDASAPETLPEDSIYRDGRYAAAMSANARVQPGGP